MIVLRKRSDNHQVPFDFEALLKLLLDKEPLNGYLS